MCNGIREYVVNVNDWGCMVYDIRDMREYQFRGLSAKCGAVCDDGNVMTILPVPFLYKSENHAALIDDYKDNIGVPTKAEFGGLELNAI